MREESIISKAVENKLRVALQEAGITQDKTAEYLNLPRQHFVAVLAGRRKLTVEQLLALIDLCGVEPNEILSLNSNDAAALQREIERLDAEISRLADRLRSDETLKSSLDEYNKVMEKMMELHSERNACVRRLERSKAKDKSKKITVIAPDNWQKYGIIGGVTEVYLHPVCDRYGIIPGKLVLVGSRIGSVVAVNGDVKVEFPDGTITAVKPEEITGVAYGIWNNLN